MEILPHFWIGYFKKNILFLKEKKIKCIVHLSKNEPFIKKNNIEEIRIPLDYDENTSLEEKNNILYQNLFDVTDFIHEKISSNKNVLLLGYENTQDLDTIITAYYIRFGKMGIQDAIYFLKSKKDNAFYPKCYFYFALNKFIEVFRKL
jgi:hypothetical protein